MSLIFTFTSSIDCNNDTYLNQEYKFYLSNIYEIFKLSIPWNIYPYINKLGKRSTKFYVDSTSGWYNLDLKQNTVWTKLALMSSGIPRMSIFTVVEQYRETFFYMLFSNKSCSPLRTRILSILILKRSLFRFTK